MAVAKMSKLRLIGLTDEKDAILNSLQKSFAVEIKEPSLSVDLKRAEVVSADEARRDAIENALAAGEKVQIAGFGSFETRQRAARTGKNPQTGEAVAIAACKAPAFKAGKSLKEAINK